MMMIRDVRRCDPLSNFPTQSSSASQQVTRDGTAGGQSRTTNSTNQVDYREAFTIAKRKYNQMMDMYAIERQRRVAAEKKAADEQSFVLIFRTGGQRTHIDSFK